MARHYVFSRLLVFAIIPKLPPVFHQFDRVAAPNAVWELLFSAIYIPIMYAQSKITPPASSVEMIESSLWLS